MGGSNYFNSLTSAEVDRPDIVEYLEGVNFNFKATDTRLGPHIAMTSGLGAASLMNDAFMFKAVVQGKEEVEKAASAITEEEKQILIDLGEWNVDKGIPSKDQVLTETNDNTNKDKKEIKTTMATKESAGVNDVQHAELMKELKALRKENSVMAAEKDLTKFEFTDDISKDISNVYADANDAGKEIMVKAFTFLKEVSEKDLEKAVEEIKKENVDKDKEGNPLKNLLDKEAGVDTNASKDIDNSASGKGGVSKSLVEILADKINKDNGVVVTASDAKEVK